MDEYEIYEVSDYTKYTLKNAEKFINELGNPYSTILLDRDGTKAID